MSFGNVVDFYNLYQDRNHIVVIDTRKHERYLQVTVRGSINIPILCYNSETFTKQVIGIINNTVNHDGSFESAMQNIWIDIERRNLLIILSDKNVDCLMNCNKYGEKACDVEKRTDDPTLLSAIIHLGNVIQDEYLSFSGYIEKIMILNDIFDKFCFYYPYFCVSTTNNHAHGGFNSLGIEAQSYSHMLSNFLPAVIDSIDAITQSYPNQIIKHRLFLGNKGHSQDVLIFENLQITHVVNCRSTQKNYFELNTVKSRMQMKILEAKTFDDSEDDEESSIPVCPDIPTMKIKYFNVTVLDVPSNADKIKTYFNNAIEFIDDALNENSMNKVLVHCTAGISRSTTIVIAYLMKIYGIGYDDAYKYVQSKRSIVKPNAGFVEKLKEFEKELSPT